MIDLARQEKWDYRFLKLAREISTWSKDPSTKVGAILANDQHEIVGTGYNGFPRGIYDMDERLQDRDKKLQLVVHAELNAILTAGHRSQGASLYVSGLPPCSECGKSIIQAGVKRVVSFVPEPEVLKRWKDSLNASRKMFREVGITVAMLPVIV